MDDFERLADLDSQVTNNVNTSANARGVPTNFRIAVSAENLFGGAGDGGRWTGAPISNCVGYECAARLRCNSTTSPSINIAGM